MTELRDWLVAKSLIVNNVYLLDIKPSTEVESAKFTYENTSLFWGKQLSASDSASKYIATLLGNCHCKDLNPAIYIFRSR